MVWLLLTGQAVISATGLLFLRFFMPLFAEKTFSSPLGTWLGLLTGIALYGASFLTWLYILSRYQVSFAYPFTIGVTLAITVSGAALLFKENISALQLVGMFLLVIAVFLVSSNPASR